MLLLNGSYLPKEKRGGGGSFYPFSLFLSHERFLKPLRPPNGGRTGEERQIQEKLVLHPEGGWCAAGSQGERGILKPRGFVFEHLLLL